MAVTDIIVYVVDPVKSMLPWGVYHLLSAFFSDINLRLSLFFIFLFLTTKQKKPGDSDTVRHRHYQDVEKLAVNEQQQQHRKERPVSGESPRDKVYQTFVRPVLTNVRKISTRDN